MPYGEAHTGFIPGKAFIGFIPLILILTLILILSKSRPLNASANNQTSLAKATEM